MTRSFWGSMQNVYAENYGWRMVNPQWLHIMFPSILNGYVLCTHPRQIICSLFWCVCCCCCHFSRVWLCVTQWTAAHQAPPSLGFSRQEHWSGLPFPSPVHESEKWKWSCSVVSDSSRPHGLQPTRLLRPWDFPGKSAGVGCHCLGVFTSPQTLPNCLII